VLTPTLGGAVFRPGHVYTSRQIELRPSSIPQTAPFTALLQPCRTTRPMLSRYSALWNEVTDQGSYANEHLSAMRYSDGRMGPLSSKTDQDEAVYGPDTGSRSIVPAPDTTVFPEPQPRQPDPDHPGSARRLPRTLCCWGGSWRSRGAGGVVRGAACGGEEGIRGAVCRGTAQRGEGGGVRCDR